MAKRKGLEVAMNEHLDLLFLDIDGVLNDHRKLPSGYCGIDANYRIHLLNRVLDSVPSLMLVVSSAWRYMILRGDMTIRGFEYLMLVSGIKCRDRIHGHTAADGEVADEPDHFDAEAWKVIGLKMRAIQIDRYVAEHRPRRFVVLDDLPLDVPNLVQTDGDWGLRERDVELIFELLQEQGNASRTSTDH